MTERLPDLDPMAITVDDMLSEWVGIDTTEDSTDSYAKAFAKHNME
jgi:hypothetical protein